MYVKIDLTDYHALRNLSFAPQADMTGDTVPINEFTVDIVTDDEIAAGQYADLYDDLDNLWAHYWITQSERSGDDARHILARSDVALLDGVILAPIMYDGTAVATALDGIMVRQSGSVGVVATIDYSLSSDFDSETITGYCPEQTARERLQWVCFVIGAYVRSCFNGEIEIEPIGTTATRVPADKTVGEPKPKVKYSDYVTAIHVTGYTFTEGTPTGDEESVTVGGTTYIVTPQAYSLINTAAPAGAADNAVDIDGVYLVNGDNAAAVLTRVAGYRFSRASVELDAINNSEYIPGDKVNVYATERQMFSGYLESCAFSFGVQARSKMVVGAAEALPTALLTVLYKYGGRQLDKKEYALPVGFAYEIENPWIDTSYSGHRYIFRPTTESVTGTMASGGATATVEYEAALDLYNGVLTINNVDEITTETEDGLTIGVIA